MPNLFMHCRSSPSLHAVIHPNVTLIYSHCRGKWKLARVNADKGLF